MDTSRLLMDSAGMLKDFLPMLMALPMTKKEGKVLNFGA
jgi:hypothetical protein